MPTRPSIPRSRLLSSLTSSSATPVSTLIPPYSHSQAIPQEPSPSLRPPYAHNSVDSRNARNVQPTLKYALVDRVDLKRQEEEKYLAWTGSLDETTINRAWVETLEGLQKLEGAGTQVPEIAFHELSQHLAAKSTVKDLKKIGLVLVRDVIADAHAQAVGEEIRSYVQLRNGHPSYWHQLLLALRANPSILSANSQVMAALTGKEAKFIKADTLSALGHAWVQSVRLEKPWISDRALSAHIALSPSRSGAYQVSPSLHAARYAALRPFFKPLQSRISFYNKEGYLDPSNWAASAPRYSVEPESDLPHLTNKVDLPEIRAGDIIYSHAGLPIIPTRSDVGLTDFLPVSPLGAASARDVRAQRETFEQGLPPPHVFAEGSIGIEEAGVKESLISNGGRSAMGY